jgi:hypothetical protein
MDVFYLVTISKFILSISSMFEHLFLFYSEQNELTSQLVR